MLLESQRRARVESELWWLDQLRGDLQLSVPVATRTPAGEGAISVAVEGMAPPRLCTPFHWLDGRFPSRWLVPWHLEAIGRLTARLHEHSARLRVPAWFDRPTVDQADAQTEEEVARLFTDHLSVEAADVMCEVIRRVRRVQAALGSGSDTFDVIHADIHQKNYLIQGDELRLSTLAPAVGATTSTTWRSR
jgi:Ser/Thr protein kinase RdoA (MazF antagonist)